MKLWWTLLTVAIVAALAPAAAVGSFPGGNGVIAYEAERSIWAVDPNTGNGLRLTSGADDSAPSFSASGSMLAFQRWAAGRFTVYLARADGADAKALIQGGEPAFSPSGRQIVFVRPGGLFVTRLAPGSPVREITDHPGDRTRSGARPDRSYLRGPTSGTYGTAVTASATSEARSMSSPLRACTYARS